MPSQKKDFCVFLNQLCTCNLGNQNAEKKKDLSLNSYWLLSKENKVQAVGGNQC